MKGGTVSPFDQRRGSAFERADLEMKVRDHPNAPILKRVNAYTRSAWS